jgi:hypothetical protein
MKRIAVLLLVAVLCLSLCACGSSKELEKYKKYETLIDHLENGDYTSAHLEIDELSQSENQIQGESGSQESQKITTVEITMENWQDYFELRLVAGISRDHFDEVEDTFAKWRLYLKEEYWGKVPEADVAFGYYATEACECNFSYDLDTEILSYSVVQLYSDWQEEGTCGFERSKDYYYAVGEAYIRNYTDLGINFFGTWDDSIQVNDNIVTWRGDGGFLNIEITRVQGSITLTAE